MPSCALVYHIQIQACHSNGELKDLRCEDQLAFVAECGFIKPATKEMKEDIPGTIKAAFLEHVVVKTTQEIAQFVEGLEIFQIVTLLRNHPQFFYHTDTIRENKRRLCCSPGVSTFKTENVCM